MTCQRCKGLGVIFKEGKTPDEIINRCGCFIKKVYSKSMRNIYSSSKSFMDNENKIQFESDYPDHESIMKANGSFNGVRK